jgi:hypothetical protein
MESYKYIRQENKNKCFGAIAKTIDNLIEKSGIGNVSSYQVRLITYHKNFADLLRLGVEREFSSHF